MPASTPEPNLVTNLFLIEDIMLTLENIKQENFQLLTNQVYCFFSNTTSIHWKLWFWFQIEQSLYKKCDNVSGVLIEDTKILMQFYTEKNQKLRKMISRMKSRNSSLGRNMLAETYLTWLLDVSARARELLPGCSEGGDTGSVAPGVVRRRDQVEASVGDIMDMATTGNAV